MKKVLVIYYTQSGQLNQAVRATLKNFESDSDVTVHYEELKPVSPFPFPWSYMQFFDTFPETVKGISCGLQPFRFNAGENYDLIILAYQPWFLSVSIPMNSFLQTDEASQLLKNKNVVTIIACRNMWLNAQEKMKIQLKNLGANLRGNITYVDRAPNLISLITVLAFALGGVKDKFMGIFPKYGVSDEELIHTAHQHGHIVLNHLHRNEFVSLQKELIASGAVTIKPNLMLMEGRGKILFPLYADFILKKGKAGKKERRNRVRIFGIVLPLLILILSPFITLVSRLMPLIKKSETRRLMEYHAGVDLLKQEP